MINKIIPFIIVIIFGVIAGYSLLHPGLPPTHDGEYHVIRFYEFNKVLRSGEIYPRWAPDLNNGAGVPLFNYVYPLPNYIASFLHFFGISFIDAFKLNMFFATLIGGIFFYLWTKDYWGKVGGIVSSVFYTFSPYHFLDIYIRGSVGEVWALAFFPAYLWSITIYIKERNKQYILLSSVFLALTILSHNILGLMFFLFSIIYILLLIYQSKNKKYLILNTISFILIGLGLSAVFWMPALLENNFVTGLQIYNIEENFPEVFQLLIPSWGSGFSAGELENQMSFQIGIANLFIVLLSFGALFFIKGNRSLSSEIKNQRSNIKNAVKGQRKLILFFLICFIIVFFLMLKVSLPVWNTIPLLNYFQFPWRLLSLEIVISSFLAGSIFSIWKECSIKAYIIAAFMIVLAVGLTFEYSKPAYYHYRDDKYYTTRSNFIDGTNSPGNFFNTIWANEPLKKQRKKIYKGEGKVSSEIININSYKADYYVLKDSDLILNIAYFPGWKVFVNKMDVRIFPSKEGLISFPISKGKNQIEVKFEDTLVRAISKVIFLISLSCILLLSMKFRHVKINK